MRERRTDQESTPADNSPPLIGIFVEDGGPEAVRYFVSESEADSFVSESDIQGAIDLAGAWSDLDWNEMRRALDRIRHESPPSAPISA